MEFNVQEKLDMFNAPVYTEYREILSQHDGPLVLKNGLIHLNGRKLKPPQIVRVADYVTQMKQRKQEVLTQYHKLYIELMNSANPKNYKQDYENLVAKIQTIEKNIEHAQHYLVLVNKNARELATSLSTQYTNSLNDINTYSTTGMSMTNTGIKTTLKDYQKVHDIDNKIHDLKKQHVDIDYFIEALPVLDAKEVKNVSNVVKEHKNVQNTKTPASKKISPQQLQTIKANVKKLIEEKFPFKNKEECLSRKKQFFMSTKDIIDEIEKTPEIKNIMPPKFKTLTKEKICDHLFF